MPRFAIDQTTVTHTWWRPYSHRLLITFLIDKMLKRAVPRLPLEHRTRAARVADLAPDAASPPVEDG